MNKVILLALLMPVTAFGQIIENFESGNLSGWIQSPEGHWNTDYEKPVSGTGSLHHSFDNTEAGLDWIGTEIRNLHPERGKAEWSFTVRHGYDPSASNNWAVFLMSDSDPASAGNGSVINGYAVGVNQTGYDDTLRLWKVKSGVFRTVVNSHLNWQTSVETSEAVKISAERSPTGDWDLKVHRINDDLIDSSGGNDAELFTIGWLLISYRYTSTRDRLLWFDDLTIDGLFSEDQGPPEDDPYLTKAVPGDVIISEIMADPSPPVALPSREYLELFNRGQETLNLKNWSLSDGIVNAVFPDKIIAPGSFMIVCQMEDTALFRCYGKTTGLKSFPALTNEGKILFIRDSKKTFIHGVEYSSDWYCDILRSGGGWSLEIIDADYPFFEYGNWRASRSEAGGTPGKINSVSGANPDIVFSGIENVFPDDSSKVKIRFSETIIDLNKRIESLELEGSIIDTLLNSDPLFREYIVFLDEPLEHGRIYTLTIGNEITDFAGNRMEKNEFRFGMTEPVRRGDILFNELLFNPFPGEPDFIEFYNCSDRIINVSDLMLVSVNDELHDTSSVVLVSAENHCLLPCNYNVITTNKRLLLDRFSLSVADNIFEVSSLPSMPDDKGHLILFDRHLEKIDEVFYDEKQHYSLLNGYEGISLEKVMTNSISTDKTQWHSASESAGWGTPGAANSVLIEHPEDVNKINMSSTKITPDNDGNEDFLVINFNLAGLGNVISIDVFDETGRFVKRLTDNLLAGPETSVVWNGTAADEKLVSTGIYILLITVFNDSGKVEKWKKVCTVIR
jgi:Lamin Tail Domain/CHU_C Type IX secretion signal domain